MLDDIGVVFVRHFPETGSSLGVGCDDGSYYVYDRQKGASAFDWHMHCGPYSTFEQGVDWIKGIRESRNLQACPNCGGSGSLLDMSCCPNCGGGGKVLR